MNFRKNWFTTIGGIMAGFGLVPIALGTGHVKMPDWLYIACIFVGTLGPVVIGVGAKGQDEHSSTPAPPDQTPKP